MKTFIRFFFRSLRTVLGPVVLFKEAVSQPKGLKRSADAQEAVDLACKDLALYQYKTCPFCIKVRQEMRRLSLDVDKVDAQHEGPARVFSTCLNSHEPLFEPTAPMRRCSGCPTAADVL